MVQVRGLDVVYLTLWETLLNESHPKLPIIPCEDIPMKPNIYQTTMQECTPKVLHKSK